MTRATAWLAGLVFVTATAWAGPGSLPPPADYAQIGTLSSAQARSILDEFRSGGLVRPAYLEFVLRQLPRRGPEVDYPGRLWIGRDDSGPVWRVEILAGGGPRFLIRGGSDAAVWRHGRTTHDPVSRVPLGEPLLPGIDLTPFDLLMPFVYWSDAQPAGVERVLGRPADAIIFRPSLAEALQVPGIAAVRAFLDGEYHAPVQVESLDTDGNVIKTLSLVSLKRVSGQILPKDVDVRDERTRDKTRFSVTGADLGVELSPALFAPETLRQAVRPPPPEQVQKL